tara:strand:- start:32 stop:370 length:339 start_codon:yes stop_codon:yes gene_type:complete
MDEEANNEFMESLGSLFGYMDTLGCNATFSEFESWYLSIEGDLNNVLIGADDVPAAEAVPMEALYEQYSAFCEAISLDITPPTIAEKTEEKPNNLGKYLIGGALLYFLFKKK